jgi:nitrate reductase cytochrome c-type subunit
MLFAPNDNPTSQTDNFCFQCHDSASSVQAVTNYSYSKTFGGGTSPIPDDIKDAFAFGYQGAPGSSHNLADVLNYAIDHLGYTTSDNACMVCHNPHTAQDNTSVESSGHGGVKTAVINPGQHTDYPGNLWGDEPFATSGFNEMMSDYTTTKYQAPYYGDKSAPDWELSYEPSGNDSPSDGSNLPNFVGTCRNQCHRTTAVWSTERGRNLKPVNWTKKTTQPGYRNVHGKLPNEEPSVNMGYTIAPYEGGKDANYVLACTDCHEPHGSTNKWLLRTTVNGKDISTTITDNSRSWYQFCTACHVITGLLGHVHEDNYPEATPCDVCHNHNDLSGRPWF